ncbi:hypothetical protein V8C35DRAFT_284880 [Trichoderma chlorosporum]
MKFLAITALFVAGALAVPAANYPPPPPPPPPYEDGNKGGIGYGGDYGDYYPGGHEGGGGGYGNVPTPTPTPGYGNGGSGGPGKPPTGGDGHPPHGGSGGGHGDGGSHGGNGDDSGFSPCPSGLYSNPQCCSTDVLGILGLDCSTR